MDEDRQEVFDALCERASQLFGKDASEFTLDTKFADLNIKSVQVSQITTYLEDELDRRLTRKHRPVLANTSSQKLAEGEIAEVDIAIVPTARVYHKGERFRIQIAGRYIREGLPPLSLLPQLV